MDPYNCFPCAKRLNSVFIVPKRRFWHSIYCRCCTQISERKQVDRSTSYAPRTLLNTILSFTAHPGSHHNLITSESYHKSNTVNICLDWFSYCSVQSKVRRKRSVLYPFFHCKTFCWKFIHSLSERLLISAFDLVEIESVWLNIQNIIRSWFRSSRSGFSLKGSWSPLFLRTWSGIRTLIYAYIFEDGAAQNDIHWVSRIEVSPFLASYSYW